MHSDSYEIGNIVVIPSNKHRVVLWVGVVIEIRRAYDQMRLITDDSIKVIFWNLERKDFDPPEWVPMGSTQIIGNIHEIEKELGYR